MFASFLFGWARENLRRQEGQAMAEYGIILALIAAVCITLLVTLGTDIKGAIQKLLNSLPAG